MDLKKAVFLGGAVLLLAACDRATAPNALVREGGPAAAAKAAPKSPATGIGNPVGLFGDCENGMFFREGRDSVCATEAP
jgi:hypothetical protein